MTWAERLANYERVTGFMPHLFVCQDGTVVGTMVLGNNYRVSSGYYGGYPPTYLRRVRALFPDKRDVLHLFSGMVDLSELPGDTVDVNPALGASYVDDAQSLEGVPLDWYDLAVCDPPYSVEDADHYKTSMVKRNKVMAALARMPSGAHVAWLDQVLPLYRKDTWAVEARIGIVKSTNHRFRVLTIFRRK